MTRDEGQPGSGSAARHHAGVMRELSRDPAPLIRRVYAYVAYRIGDGPDAEDVTSDVFERALRYSSSFDATKGSAISWLLGIARRCIDDARFNRDPFPEPGSREREAPGDLAANVSRRLEIASAVATLDQRSRDLIALRYGADLPVKAIAKLGGSEANAVEVALHRARARLKVELVRASGRAAQETDKSLQGAERGLVSGDSGTTADGGVANLPVG